MLTKLCKFILILKKKEKGYHGAPNLSGCHDRKSHCDISTQDNCHGRSPDGCH
jgi:hypothetical protein